MISRRNLVFAGTAAGTVALLPASLLHGATNGQAEGTQTGNVSDYLSVTTASDAKFASNLNKFFPGLLNDPVFAKIQSHAALISNISGKSINAYSTHWNADTPTGGYETTVLHYFHPSVKHRRTAKFGLVGNKTRFTGKVSLHKPGVTRLVTPYFNWSQGFYHANPSPQWDKILQESASRRFFLYELSHASSVQITVESVIVNHQTLVGADRSNLGMIFRVTRNAEHDEAGSILRLIKSGMSMDRVAAVLQQRASSTPTVSRVETAHYLYTAA